MLKLVLVPKNSEFANVSEKDAHQHCILISRSLHKTLPKILFDWFTLSFEFLTHNTK